MTHNDKEIDAEELFELLESISKFVDTKIKMYALGGTALTILKIKKSTRDIDINIHSQKEYKYIKKIFEEIGFEKIGTIRWFTQEGLAFDLFHGSSILGTHLLTDCLKKSKFIKAFHNIELYTLALEDIIISKLARGDNRDFEDMKLIFEKEKINNKKLIERYKETMENSIVSEYKQKILDLVEIKFEEWNKKIPTKLIEDIKKWD
ncbi:MAG: DUF6036 family nucleotidyltransferase [Patescibacteria group bacterium]|nr:DUF6036 family nucleotidyltransferase [Patescibacteria group bacterium]